MDDPGEYSQCDPSASIRMPLQVGRLTPWLPLHEDARAALMKHLLSLEGSTYAARNALARRCNAYPLKVEADWALLLGEGGELRVVALGDATLASFNDWLQASPAAAARWRAEVWSASLAQLPAAFTNLQVAEPAG